MGFIQKKIEKAARIEKPTPEKTVAQKLLDALGPVDRTYDMAEVGDFGNPARTLLEDYLEPHAQATKLGPIEKVYVFWFLGASCDGCTISTLGATAPTIEALMVGGQPGLPRLVIHHAELSLEGGPHYLYTLGRAIRGELDAPYVVVLEGSANDETIAHEQGGQFYGNGEMPWGPDGEIRAVTASEWVARLAPAAAATIAIGTCASWGNIPAAEGNPTGAMSLMDLLGEDYRSTFGLPPVNVPGCPPIGDAFMETVAAILYFLQGFGPMPEFDELGRPAWQFGETVHRHCVRGAYYEEGDFAQNFGDPNCLVEIGCWGPVVNCQITSRGYINHVGGCMNVGGPCIGCMMPGFPDKFTPFYKEPPGSGPSSWASRAHGRIFRSLRMHTNEHLNRERRWDIHHHTPSGWALHRPEPGPIRELTHRFYDAVRQHGDRGKSPAEAWGKRYEWTERKRPADERETPGGEESQDGTAAPFEPQAREGVEVAPHNPKAPTED